MRKLKGTLLLTSAVIVLPALAGILLWNRLPDQMVTHWGVDGTANGWSGKAFAVFGLPLILLAVHWFSVWMTARDPGNKAQSRKTLAMVLWILPILSLVTCGSIYGMALNEEFPIETLMLLMMGALFLIIGNYLPKCRRNRTIGVKVKWALESEENWNATHRMSGRLWMAGGLLFCLCGFLGGAAALWAMGVVLPVMVLVPVAYSYRYHQKQVREGRFVPEDLPKSAAAKKTLILSGMLTAVLLAGATILCFTGEIGVVYGEESFTIEASYYQDLTVAYETVDGVELLERDAPGRRQFGFGTPRLLMGQFRNEAFGVYTRYSYTRCPVGVVLRSGEKVLVVSGADQAATRAIYEELSTRCG